jgi:hypothetical protein
MSFRSFVRSAAFVGLAIFATAPSAAADAGIKFGPTFASFSSDVLDFDNRTGLYGGLFFGGNRDGVIGLQGEINWIRKQAELGLRDIRIDYLQIPALLRLNAGTQSPNGFTLYGIAGPAVEIKIADEIEGFTLDDGIEGADVSLVFGGGFEVARIIVEGRYTKGFRRINNLFEDLTEIKSQSFSVLFGVRFN